MWKQICACMYHSFWWSFLWFSLAFSGYYCSLVPGMFVCIEGQWVWPLPLVNDNGQMIASQLPLLPPFTPASLPLVSQDKWYCQYICKKRKIHVFSEGGGDVAIGLARLRHHSCMCQNAMKPMVQLLWIPQSQSSSVCLLLICWRAYHTELCSADVTGCVSWSDAINSWTNLEVIFQKWIDLSLAISLLDFEFSIFFFPLERWEWTGLIFWFGSDYVGIRGLSWWSSGIYLVLHFIWGARLSLSASSGLELTCSRQDSALFLLFNPIQRNPYWISEVFTLELKNNASRCVGEVLILFHWKWNAPAIPSVMQRGDIMRTMQESWQDSSSWWYPSLLNSVSPSMCMSRMQVCPHSQS